MAFTNQSDGFSQLSTSYSSLTPSQLTALFTSTILTDPSIADLQLVGKFKVLSYVESSGS